MHPDNVEEIGKQVDLESNRLVTKNEGKKKNWDDLTVG